ncbi:unnamed protein product [Owenia fusiformis]|uniref:arylamine N-acetyltransferase n=1 Tax=Owenia fusiformis TaxID=6347 RepID=A0A8J1YBV6_OWEFU|nr:unnamed protein product [Owenia fusiformis]
MEAPTLNKDEVEYFLTDILQIHNWNEQLGNNRVEFLNHLMIKYQQIIPFQTITLMSEDVESRTVPKWSEIKTDIFAKTGGMCHTMNTFMWALLKGLGYDVYLVLSSVVSIEQYLKKNLDHTIVIVRDLTIKGSLHVVDCGLGLAMREAIIIKNPTKDQDSLNETIYQGSNEIFKYVRTEGGTYVRYHKKPKKWESTNDWRLSYWFDIQPTDFAEFYYDHALRIYLGTPMEEIHHFHYIVFLTRLDGERRIKIKNYEIMVENEEHIMETSDIPQDELSDHIIRYFPGFKGKEDIMKKAFENMEKIKERLSIKKS